MKRYKAALILSATLLAMTACTHPTGGHSPTPTDSSTPTDPSDSLRTYYESLVSDLKQEILDLKQQEYLSRIAYESRIAELESILNTTDHSPMDSDIPVSAPDLPPSESTPPSNGTISFHYVIQNGTAVICAYLGQSDHVTIPREIVGYPVSSIADNAFAGTSVTSVIVPDTVTELGWFAFADCTSLTSVTLPASVASIGYGAFDGCPNLTVYCPKDSYAAQFAISFGLRVRYL